ncbi:MAG TPA: UDP-N-acetylmuramate dehydrogenase [Fimbriimonadales bacterium]|nr:UDP-N-acetylmuramate dehydrogenase [Fimbriimonadales bacterium]
MQQKVMEEQIAELEKWLPECLRIHKEVPLHQYTTLQTGGNARYFVKVSNIEDFALVTSLAQQWNLPHWIIGSGSNLLPSDKGVPGLVIFNACSRIDLDNDLYAETGCWFQDLYLKSAQRGLAGLEFAVGIPGTLGGALVSNAGAYRANIAERLAGIEIVENGERRWVKPHYLQFGYRDSILRRPNAPSIALLAVRLRLEPGDSKRIYDLAREYQRQRISKQPPQASAGSFFKNVEDKAFAETLDLLPEKLKEAGVVPAGFLIEHAGLKGARCGRAIISKKHANFICNLGGATATQIATLANRAKTAVYEKYGVRLEEEVLYFGDWSDVN